MFMLQIQGFEKARSTFGRLQHYNGFIHCFVSIVRQEGVLGFYKGAFPALIKVCYTCTLYIQAKNGLFAGCGVALGVEK